LLYRGQLPELHALRFGLGVTSSNPGGARCSEPGSPAGDGKATSHSAPLQGWSFCLQNAAVAKSCTPHVHSNTLRCHASLYVHHNMLRCHSPVTSSCGLQMHQKSGAGDGELRSPQEPVGRPHLGSGAKPQCPGCMGTRVVVHYDSATRTVSFRCRCGWRDLASLTKSGDSKCAL